MLMLTLHTGQYIYTTIPSAITVAANQKVDLLCIIHNQSLQTRIQIQEGGQSRIQCIIYGNDDDQASIDMVVALAEPNAQADVHVLSLAAGNSIINADTSIAIQKNAQQTKAHLLQENILLSDYVRVRSTPQLDIHANDVQASHGARYEKIDDTKLFYMMSRGLNRSQATQTILEGYLQNISDNFDEIPDKQRQHDIISYIL